MKASEMEFERRALLEGTEIEDDEIHPADNDGFVRGILESGNSPWPRRRTGDGGNCIHEAIRRCQPRRMEALVGQIGRDAVNERDSSGMTCLDLAESRSGDGRAGRQFQVMADYLMTIGGRRGRCSA